MDAPDCDYLAPSLAVDANGNIGLGCTRTSETEFPSVCVMMHAAGDPKNTMRPPVLAAKGTTVFSSNRPSKYGLAWGNYNTHVCRPLGPDNLLDVPGIRDQQCSFPIHHLLGCLQAQVNGCSS